MALELTEIRTAIAAERGNIGRAAKRLGVARRTLQNRMREYRLPRGRAGRRRKMLRYRSRASSAALGIGAAVVFGGILLSRYRKA